MSYHSFKKKSEHGFAERKTHGARGVGRPRQERHFNALLFSNVTLASHISEQMILNMACHQNGQQNASVKFNNEQGH